MIKKKTDDESDSSFTASPDNSVELQPPTLKIRRSNSVCVRRDSKVPIELELAVENYYD